MAEVLLKDEDYRKKLISEMLDWWTARGPWHGLKRRWNERKLKKMPLNQVKAIYHQRYQDEVANLNKANPQIPLFPDVPVFRR